MRVRSVTTFVTLGIVAALTVAAPASAHSGRELSTSLTGAAEVPGPGDPDGVGTASLRFDHGFRGICFEIHVAGIALPATAAHIHLGSSGVAGPVVVTLIPPDASGNVTGCVSASRDLIKTIAKHPSDYYVNVHTTDYPNGAVRGQLGKGSDHHTDEGEGDQILRARLSGPSEVPGPGDPDGRGEAVIAVIPAQNEICFILVADHITLPAIAAHIHQGQGGVAGPVVVTLTPPGGTGTSAGCIGGLSNSLLTAILANPGNYYVNVHTTDYPNGAIRGQLSGNGNGQGCGDDDGDDRSVRAAPRRDGGGGCGDDDDQGEDD